jgi:hypothetical protein
MLRIIVGGITKLPEGHVMVAFASNGEYPLMVDRKAAGL